MLFFFQSFVVRGSQRAKYALSLRIAMAEDTVVRHFLIQVNQQSKPVLSFGRHLCLITMGS